MSKLHHGACYNGSHCDPPTSLHDRWRACIAQISGVRVEELRETFSDFDSCVCACMLMVMDEAQLLPRVRAASDPMSLTQRSLTPTLDLAAAA